MLAGLKALQCGCHCCTAAAVGVGAACEAKPLVIDSLQEQRAVMIRLLWLLSKLAAAGSIYMEDKATILPQIYSLLYSTFITSSPSSHHHLHHHSWQHL
jgi:hypothetical protein